MRRQERADLLGSVGAHPARRPDHQACLFQNLIAGASLQKLARQVARERDAWPENQDQYQVEFQQQLHSRHISGDFQEP
jgi:hypothetical protein